MCILKNMKQSPDPSTSSPVRPWKLLSSSTALDEKWFPVRKDVVQLPSGKIVDDYFVWEAPHIVDVVPVTPDGSFVLVRQYRHAMGKIMVQFPAGAQDKGETPEQAAARELEEETGYRCRKLVQLGTTAPYVTKMTGTNSIFIALDATPTGTAHYDEQEESEVVIKTLDELFTLIDSKKLIHAQLPANLLLALRYLRKITT
jgi:ADP-ribose pyrophosphatase